MWLVTLVQSYKLWFIWDVFIRLTYVRYDYLPCRVSVRVKLYPFPVLNSRLLLLLFFYMYIYSCGFSSLQCVVLLCSFSLRRCSPSVMYLFWVDSLSNFVCFRWGHADLSWTCVVGGIPVSCQDPVLKFFESFVEFWFQINKKKDSWFVLCIFFFFFPFLLPLMRHFLCLFVCVSNIVGQIRVLPLLASLIWKFPNPQTLPGEKDHRWLGFES